MIVASDSFTSIGRDAASDRVGWPARSPPAGRPRGGRGQAAPTGPRRVRMAAAVPAEQQEHGEPGRADAGVEPVEVVRGGDGRRRDHDRRRLATAVVAGIGADAVDRRGGPPGVAGVGADAVDRRRERPGVSAHHVAVRRAPGDADGGAAVASVDAQLVLPDGRAAGRRARAAGRASTLSMSAPVGVSAMAAGAATAVAARASATARRMRRMERKRRVTMTPCAEDHPVRSDAARLRRAGQAAVDPR